MYYQSAFAPISTECGKRREKPQFPRWNGLRRVRFATSIWYDGNREGTTPPARLKRRRPKRVYSPPFTTLTRKVYTFRHKLKGNVDRTACHCTLKFSRLITDDGLRMIQLYCSRAVKPKNDSRRLAKVICAYMLHSVQAVRCTRIKCNCKPLVASRRPSNHPVFAVSIKRLRRVPNLIPILDSDFDFQI